MTARDPWIKALVIVMLLIAATYLAGLIWQVTQQFADIILLFFLAWVISFILEPLVALLHLRARLPHQVAVLAAYLAVLVGVTLAIVQLTPRLSEQIVQLATDLPAYADATNSALLEWQSELASKGIVLSPESLLSYQQVVQHIETLGPSVVSNALGLATGVANLLFQTFIILILSYYMTLDGQRLSAGMLVALPRAYRDDARYFLVSVNRAFAGFMRGQLAQAFIYGLATAAVMSFAGLNLVLLPSMAAGAFMLIPFIGPFLAMVLPLLICAVKRPDSFWMLLVALFILQQIVTNVIAPRLMSESVGLHPLLVFFAFLAGARVAGVWGALFGVPIVAVATAMVSFYRATVEDRHIRLIDATSGEAAEHLRPEVEANPDEASPAAAPAPVDHPARSEAHSAFAALARSAQREEGPTS